MKTLKDLFELVAIAVEQNSNYSSDWFIDYSGHVNTMTIKHFMAGWDENKDVYNEIRNVKLDEEGIQLAYWFIKTRLIK